jgi:hypothetical protein
MVPTERWKRDPGMKVGAAYGAKATGSKQRGIRYHNKVYAQLIKLLRPEPGVKLLIEPWYKCLTAPRMRSPDSVILLPDVSAAVVVEVKLNWKDGRDVKLIDEYLPIVKAAEEVDMVWPLLITQCLRGAQQPPLLGLRRWEDAMSWQPGDPTPLMLVL